MGHTGVGVGYVMQGWGGSYRGGVGMSCRGRVGRVGRGLSDATCSSKLHIFSLKILVKIF